MNDFRSFVRYLIPGLTLFVETVILLALANIHTVWRWIAQIPISDIATLLGAVLATTGVGYLIGMLHHNIYWLSDFYAANDPRGVIRRLQIGNHLVLVHQDGAPTANPIELSRAGAWRVVSAIWHARRESSERIKGADPRASSLSDLMHGAGTALIASVLSILIAAVIAFTLFEQPHVCAFLIGSVILFVMHCYAYGMTGDHAQGYVDLVLFEELSRPPAQPSVPVPLIYAVSRRDVAG